MDLRQKIYDFRNSLARCEWAVYDIQDGTVIYVGKYRDACRVQEEGYGGLMVVPVEK